MRNIEKANMVVMSELEIDALPTIFSQCKKEFAYMIKVSKCQPRTIFVRDENAVIDEIKKIGFKSSDVERIILFGGVLENDFYKVLISKND